jgi:predicted transcriptional regulator
MVLKVRERAVDCSLRLTLRHQFVLDKKSNRLLEELAESRGGNRSRVVREAIAVYADQEAYLEKIESDPKFIERMEKSAVDIRAGRVSGQAEVERRFAKKRKRK